MLELLSYLQSLHPVDAAAQAMLATMLKQQVVLKGKHWLKQGAVCDRIAFIREGLVRVYFESGSKEACLWYNKEKEVMISVFSFYFQTPSDFAIQAVEDTTILYITHAQLQQVYAKFPGFNINGRKVLEQYYSYSEMHVRLLLSPTQKRLEMVSNLYPWMMHDERITNKMLAAYIGVTPEHLSRFKSTRRKNSNK